MKKPSSSIRIEKPGADGKPAGPGVLPGGVVFLEGLWAGVWQWLHPAGNLTPAVLPIAAAAAALCLGLLVRWEKPGRLAALAAVLLALTATPLVWASRQSAAYRRYMDALNGSVLYAREHDGVWLERAGSRVHYPQLAGAGISEKLRQAGMGKRQQELPEGEGVTLDFGDGSLLRLWEVPIRGGYTPEETFGVFVAYTYPDGETYCYDTDNLGWDRVVDSLPSAG